MTASHGDGGTVTGRRRLSLPASVWGSGLSESMGRGPRVRSFTLHTEPESPSLQVFDVEEFTAAVDMCTKTATALLLILAVLY